MANYAIVDGQGVVTNIIVWDGQAAYEQNDSATLVVAEEKTKISDTWNGKNFVSPDPPPIDDSTII